MMKVIHVLLLAIGFAAPAFGAPPNATPDARPDATPLDAQVAQCADCHGADGVSAHEDVPTIAGQDAAFLERALRTYREWGRPCIKSAYRAGDTTRPKTDMCRIAEGLSDEDMRALAEHYAAQPFRAATQPFDPALAETGAALHHKHCDGCHGDGGEHADPAPGWAASGLPTSRPPSASSRPASTSCRQPWKARSSIAARRTSMR